MKVVMDIILNHSGSVHKWFIQSRDNIKPYDDYYVWHKGKVNVAEDQAPNNWVLIPICPAHFFESDCKNINIAF